MIAKSFSVQGLILWKKEHGDHDCIVSLLTKERGILNAFAKNAKKSVRRFGGVLELYTLIDAVLSPSRNHGLYNMTEASIEAPYDKIRTDINRMAYASYWSETVSLWLEEGHPEKGIFFLLCDVLDYLNAGRIPAETLGIIFQIKMLQLSGLSPDFKACCGCGKPCSAFESRSFFFDIKDGRLRCPECVSNYGTGKNIRISRGTLSELKWIQKNSCKTATRIRLNYKSVSESRGILEKFLPFHMGREIKSLKFLYRIRADCV